MLKFLYIYDLYVKPAGDLKPVRHPTGAGAGAILHPRARVQVPFLTRNISICVTGFAPPVPNPPRGHSYERKHKHKQQAPTTQCHVGMRLSTVEHITIENTQFVPEYLTF